MEVSLCRACCELLLPADDGLFVEKLTFEEPYQAIKFASKEDCCQYTDYTVA